MNMSFTRGLAGAAGLALAAAFAAPAAAVPARRAAPGTQLWVARFRGMGDTPSAMAVSPHGTRVFVTGPSFGGRATGVDYKTVAYGAATGRRLWASLYSGPGHRVDYPAAVAVSPDGGTVFVTGRASGWGTRYDYATVAFSAATGRRLWASRYNGPANGDDTAAAVAVSPDGATVFVTGSSQGRTTGVGYATVAYRAATGRRLWASRYNGPEPGIEGAISVAVSPDGARVFVTGLSEGRRTWNDFATVAYGAATGRQLWASRYNGPANDEDDAAAVAVSPDGAMVFVTGDSYGPTTQTDYATIAYRAATGRQLWVSRYNDSANQQDFVSAMAVSPDGATVFVTGSSDNYGGYATVAYRAATGRQLWVSRYRQGAATSVAVSPDGATVYVTGTGFSGDGDDYATVAYRAATGRQLRVSRYNSPVYGNGADSVAVSPDGATVFVTGTSLNTTTGYDCATIAYHG